MKIRTAKKIVTALPITEASLGTWDILTPYKAKNTSISQNKSFKSVPKLVHYTLLDM